MDEHDDDLASQVHEDAAEETDSFPGTADELQDDRVDETWRELDEDESEL